MDISRIDIRTLPSVCLTQRRSLPNISACYLVVEGDAVIYVGQSNSLVVRWLNHDKLKDIKARKTSVKIAWIECIGLDDLRKVERSLIRFFKPELNKQLMQAKRKKVASNPNEARVYLAHADLLKPRGRGVISYWLNCLCNDPCGEDFVLMDDQDLRSTTKAKYRKILQELSLFDFETRQCGKQKSLWLKNLYGSQVVDDLE